ncbi:MAG: MFS transporter [SAR202 cluster bacterium]|nr:MFS transporter [SAR202 cluster bacterium]
MKSTPLRVAWRALLPAAVPHDTAWLIQMSLMLFVLLLPTSSYVAALPFIQEEWGLNNTQAGGIYSAYLAGYVVSALLVVPLTDRFGPRHILIWSAVLSLAAHLAFPLMASGDMVAAVALRAAAGVGLVGIYMPGLRLISERFSGMGRGTAIGLFVTAQYLANSASLAITGALMASMEWRNAYMAVSAVAVAGLPMAYLLLRSHERHDGGVFSGRLNLRVLFNPSVRYLILGYSLHALQLFAVRVWLPAFLVAILVASGSDAAGAAVTGATFGGLALLAGSVGPFMGGVISDRWGRATTASAIFALSGTCAWLIGWTAGLPFGLVVALCVVYGWAIAADSAIYSTGITEVSTPSNLGSTMALQASLGLVGGILGPILFGGILDLASEAQRWGFGFSSLGVVALVAIAGLQRLRQLPQRMLLASGKG